MPLATVLNTGVIQLIPLATCLDIDSGAYSSIASTNKLTNPVSSTCHMSDHAGGERPILRGPQGTIELNAEMLTKRFRSRLGSLSPEARMLSQCEDVGQLLSPPEHVLAWTFCVTFPNRGIDTNGGASTNLLSLAQRL
jgi:hypothetical protein